MRIPDPAIPETPLQPSSDGIAEITRKIKQQRFSRNDPLWIKRGAIIGAVIGSLFGAIVWFLARENGRPMFLPFEATLFIYGVLGCAVGSFVGSVIVGIIKPILAAIFWDIERYEREFGTSEPRKHKSTKM